MKRLLSALIIATIIFAQTSSFGLFASAAELEDDAGFITLEMSDPSDFGYANYKFVDENGNEVDFDENNFGNYRVTNSSESSTNIPASYDSRAYNYVTTPKYQGNSGSCWVFSTLSTLESDSIIQGITDINTADFSEAHFAWFAVNSRTTNTNDPTYGDGKTYKYPYQAGGNWLMSTAALSRWSGAASDKDYPSTFNDLSAMGNYDESERYNTGSGVIIKSAEVLSGANEVKQWVMEHGSATAAYLHNESYYNSTNGSTAYYYNLSSDEINHQITIVGWDDNYSASNFKEGCQPQYNGAWLCKNSWSAYWGDDGYFWLSYYDTSLSDFVGFSTQAADDFYNNYTYNGYVCNGYVTCSNSTMVSNVFTAKEHETISAISAFTKNENQTLEIRVYKDLPSDYVRPVQGTLAAKWTTTLDREGYHTIELPEEVDVTPGSIFSVVVKYVCDSGYIYVPLELGSNYSCNSGESFINFSAYASTWKTSAAYNASVKNFYVQALTTCNHQKEYETITEATCNKEGLASVSCSQCGKSLGEESLPKTEHTQQTTTTAATCSKEGLTTISCSVCGDVISTEVIDKLEHTPKTTTVNATCDKDGLITTSCSVCGEILSTEVIDKTDEHSPTTITTPATCSKEGVITTSCSVCGKVLGEEVIPKLDHVTKTTTTESTCSQQGVKRTSCSVCGEVFSEEYLPLLDHKYGEWGEYVLNSSTNRYVSTRYCEECNASQTQSYSAGNSGAKVVTLDEFFEILFDSFFKSFMDRIKDFFSGR